VVLSTWARVWDVPDNLGQDLVHFLEAAFGHGRDGQQRGVAVRPLLTDKERGQQLVRDRHQRRAA
jgi:hypothetical protein